MDTKLKADIAKSAVLTELLKREFRVFKPIGDRLPYDLALERGNILCRIQVKAAWLDRTNGLYAVDVRRAKTNRRVMRRDWMKTAILISQFCILKTAMCFT